MSNQREGDVIVTDDKRVVAKGDRVYNYYGMWPGKIATDPDAQGWFFITRDPGTGEGRGSEMLNGQRICSIEHAQSMGWPNA